jgi:hypothetical protein
LTVENYLLVTVSSELEYIHQATVVCDKEFGTSLLKAGDRLVVVLTALPAAHNDKRFRKAKVEFHHSDGSSRSFPLQAPDKNMLCGEQVEWIVENPPRPIEPQNSDTFRPAFDTTIFSNCLATTHKILSNCAVTSRTGCTAFR